MPRCTSSDSPAQTPRRLQSRCSTGWWVTVRCFQKPDGPWLLIPCTCDSIINQKEACFVPTFSDIGFLGGAWQEMVAEHLSTLSCVRVRS